jgi:hypothetical protein
MDFHLLRPEEMGLALDDQDIISTIPMPVLMNMVNWSPQPAFPWLSIVSMTTELVSPSVDVYQTIYYPAGIDPYYRASLTGNRLTIEFTEHDYNESVWAIIDVLKDVLRDFGISASDVSRTNIVVTRQEYGKLMPVPDEDRKAFILAMTSEYRVWSLGRFATWRQLLLDDVVEDIRFIDRAILTRDHYARHLHSSR